MSAPPVKISNFIQEKLCSSILETANADSVSVACTTVCCTISHTGNHLKSFTHSTALDFGSI